MAFQLKNWRSIAGGMLNLFRSSQTQVTDLNVGAVGRTLLEAAAVEIDELYQQIFNGLKEAIPVATYRSFNFDALPAITATGLITVQIASSDADTVIQAGTAFSADGYSLTFTSEEDVTIAAEDTSADILVAASVSGPGGNIPSGVSFSLNPSVTGFVSATNAHDFTNGQEAETEEQRKQRFQAYVTTLQRATVSALSYGAKTAFIVDANGVETERVKSASVVEPYEDDDSQPVGLIDVYVHNGVGGTSGPLIARAEMVLLGYTDTATGEKIPGWKAAGTHIDVHAATEVAIDQTCTLTAAQGFVSADLCDQAEQVIGAYMLSLDIGASYIEAEASFLVMSIPGVLNITGLAADHAATKSEKIMPGTISVTAA